MPYVILVSALGAIVATAIALFGLHSWTALKIAPFLGALLGLFFGIISLRRYQLPFDSSVESYRCAAGVGETTVNLNSALGVGLIVSLIELPSVLLGQDIALLICMAGWVCVLGGTVYRSWRSGAYPIRLDVFQITGGIACLAIFGWIMYAFAVEMRPGMQAMSWVHLAKAIFLLNAVAALVSAILSCFAIAITSSLDPG